MGSTEERIGGEKLAIDHTCIAKTPGVIERDTPLIVDIESMDLEEFNTPGPESDLERGILHRAILRLKSDYREPLLMQIIGGYSYEEIADALNLEKSAIVMRLYRAKRKLAKVLADPDNTDSLGEHDGRS